MTKLLACFLFVAACAAPGGGSGGDDDSGGPDASASGASRWDGVSHISAPDGAVYDSTWVFAPGANGYEIESGQVVISTQPVFSGDCTITIDSSHAMAAHDGTMMLDDSTGALMVRGQGDTIWQATYTSTCPDGSSSTQMLPYSAAWWPLPSTGPVPTEVIDGVANISVNAELGTGTVTLTQE